MAACVASWCRRSTHAQRCRVCVRRRCSGQSTVAPHPRQVRSAASSGGVSKSSPTTAIEVGTDGEAVEQLDRVDLELNRCGVHAHVARRRGPHESGAGGSALPRVCVHLVSKPTALAADPQVSALLPVRGASWAA